MILKDHIIEWIQVAPWLDLRQVEQDLIITTALLKIYENPVLKKSLAFRGGTALNKLYFKPPTRYSEDIDFVQINSGPIGPILDNIRDVMTSWLGKPKKFKRSYRGVTLKYQTISNEGLPLILKLEINTLEHFAVLGLHEQEFASNSSFYSGSATVVTYKLEELLGTKLRCLFQRRKGRDLFDLYTSLKTFPNLDIKAIIESFRKYIIFSDTDVSKLEFLQNVEEKLNNKDFVEDIKPLLAPNSQAYNMPIAFEYVRDKLLAYL